MKTKAERETAKTDAERGYADRMNGSYDKFYVDNKHRAAAYLQGCRLARGNSECAGPCSRMEFPDRSY